jgi:hypothetical protein
MPEEVINMKISAVFESTDHAEFAARRLTDAGVHVSHRDVHEITERGDTETHLPTEQFYFPAAGEFYTGMSYTNVVLPGSSFYPMAGHVSSELPLNGEAKLDIEVDDEDERRAKEVLLGNHGTGIHSYS